MHIRQFVYDEARKISFPDTADHKTLIFDPHTHSVFSDGHVWPKIRVGEALRDGLDATPVPTFAVNSAALHAWPAGFGEPRGWE